MIGLKGVVKSLYYWTTSHESAAGEKFSEQGIAAAEKQLNGCGTFLVVSEGNLPSELVDTGQITQALWFDCTEENIAGHPMSAMLLVQHDHVARGGTNISRNRHLLAFFQKERYNITSHRKQVRCL